MTQPSANPRKYSKGKDLDPEAPLYMYLALEMAEDDLAPTAQRVKYLTDIHPGADISFAGYHREDGSIILTLGINVGPGKAALRNESEEILPGVHFLVDAVKTLYYASPKFCSPPHASERANMAKFASILPKIEKSKAVEKSKISKANTSK